MAGKGRVKFPRKPSKAFMGFDEAHDSAGAGEGVGTAPASSR